MRLVAWLRKVNATLSPRHAGVGQHLGEVVHSIAVIIDQAGHVVGLDTGLRQYDGVE